MYFIFLVIDYAPINNNTGDCCVSNGVSHRKCVCSLSGISQCQKRCSMDLECKGYSFGMFGYRNKVCHLATISPCPVNCSQENADNLQELDPDAKCLGESRNLTSGCFIKRRGKQGDIL